MVDVKALVIFVRQIYNKIMSFIFLPNFWQSSNTILLIEIKNKTEKMSVPVSIFVSALIA